MRELSLTHSVLYFLDELDFLEAALLADDQARAFAPPVTEAIAACETVFRREREGRRRVVRAEAAVAVRNAALDAETTRFGATLLAAAGADRTSALFRRFFSVAPSHLVRQPLRKHCEHTLNVIVSGLGQLEGQPSLVPFAEPLAQLATAALAALDARLKAKADRGLLASEVEEWKEGVNRLRLSTYAALVQLAAEQGRGRAWADSFFPRASTAKGVEAPDDAVPAEPATP